MTRDEFNTATSTTTTNTTNSTTQPYHRRNAERRLSAITDDDDNDNNLNDKSRKFRWSSCFSFISTKFKKSKSPSHNKIRTSQSFEDFDSKKVNYVGPTDLFPEETIEVSETKPNCNSDLMSSLWKQQQQTQQQLPPASLSPPPRHGKNKRDSHITSSNNVNSEVNKESTTTNQKTDRRPILDPTLTPRVKPRSIKSKKQPSLLRLSLDAELLQQQQQPSSPDGVISLYYDNESISSTTAAHSSLSITPTSATQYQPFVTGTLGMKAQNKLSFSPSCSTEELPPPLPPLPPGQQQLAKNTIPLKPNTSSSSIITERPLSTQSTMTIITSNSHISQQQQQQIVDSPGSVISTVTDDELTEASSTSEKLTLKERRHRRSPLAMPDTEQLTLALKGLEQQQQQLIEQHDKKRSAPTTAIPSIPLPPITQLDKPRNRSAGSATEQQESSSDEDDSIWRQQLLEQTLAFSFQNKSRQEAMLTLEGKKASPSAAQQQRAISLQPIVNVHKLADHFTNGDRSVVQDKAQYDAIVSRTRRASSTTQQSQQDNDFQLQQQQQQRKNYRTLRARSASDSSSSSSSFNNKLILQQQQQQEQLDIITENEVVHITSTGTKNNSSNNKVFMNASVTTPETPPHHQLNAPSLISAPSTPNSIDSSVLDHDDYLNERLHNMTFVQSS